jgi:glutathione peroxidase
VTQDNADLLDIPLRRLDGTPTTLRELNAKTLLLVNVASKCGLTPQYEGLVRLQQRYRDSGFSVVGIPSNQFGGQEPGTPDEIATFCSTTYGVDFPLMEKTNVNPPERNPLYERLTREADGAGEAGDIKWNFEKFLVSGSGEVLGRWRPTVEPEAPELVAALEADLGASPPA